MTQNNGFVPQVFRATDLAGEIAPSIPKSSGGSGLGDLDAIFNFLEKFQKSMTQFEATIGRLRNVDQGGNQNPPDLPMPPAPTGTDTYEGLARPAPIEVRVPVGHIDPRKAYGKMLGALNKLVELDPEMRISDALKKARDYKELIIPEIDSALKELEDEASQDPGHSSDSTA